MKLVVLLTFTLLVSNFAYTQNLEIIDQDYKQAMEVATQNDKLIFVDFYTTWCGPCKKLDKLVFKNDSIKKVLGENFVLLKYDAENDSIFHLSKKHHVSSYPTGLILNAEGYVVNRKYGFPGEDFNELTQAVLKFTNEGVELRADNKVLSGYSSKIDISGYPTFYIDYVNRTNTKVDSIEFAQYWKEQKDVFLEEYFTTLFYFAGDDIPEHVTDQFLKNKQKYIDLYGATDVGIAMMFVSFNKFQSAVTANSQGEFTKAEKWARGALEKDFAEQLISSHKDQLEKSNVD